MHDGLGGWQVYGKATVDGVTYLDVGDPDERDKEMPVPDSSGYCAVLGDGGLRFVMPGSDEFFRVMDAFEQQAP